MKAITSLSLLLVSSIALAQPLAGTQSNVNAPVNKLKKDVFLRDQDLTLKRRAELMARGGSDAGGGDFIRSTFLEASRKIRAYLRDTEQGQQIVRQNDLSLEKLEEVSTVDRMTVVDEELVDRTGSLVDAVVKDGFLYLNANRWQELLTQQGETHVLIFHELLRLAGTNDENYVVSKSIRSLPEQYQTIAPGLRMRELAPDGALKTVLTMKDPIFAGVGCPLGGRTRLELNSANNTVALFTNDFSRFVGDSVRKSSDYASCNVAIPADIAPGYRVRVTQMDVFGEAFGDKAGTAMFAAEVFSAGSHGQMLRLTPEIGAGPFLERETLSYATQCGEPFNFRVNSSIRVKTSASNKDLGMRVSAMKFYFKVEKCN